MTGVDHSCCPLSSELKYFTTPYIHPSISSTTMTADVASTAITYAMLLLADAGVEITADRVGAILAAANITVEPIKVSMFVKDITADDVKTLCKSVSAGAGAASAAAPVAAAAVEAPAAAAGGKKAAPKEEEPEEEMGFSLFD